MTDKPQDDTIKGRIIGLLQKGYNRGQLVNDFSFAERTVDSAIKDYREQEGSEAEEPKKGDDFDSRALSLPAKLDIKQVIAPEYLIKHLSFVDGGQRQTFIDALLVYEAALRSVMEDIVIIQGLASAQAQITDTQLKLLREAKSDSKEVAHAAAETLARHLEECLTFYRFPERHWKHIRTSNVIERALRRLREGPEWLAASQMKPRPW